jgi:hypothetical protein
MKSARLRTLGLSVVALATATALGLAQIERLDLSQMVSKMDDAVVGTIIEKHAIRIDHPVDGPELYFTHMTIEGHSLVTGEAKTVVVTYNGGWVDAEQGAHNSEAPTEDDTRKGNRVVAFYAWTDNMGGDLAANGLIALHGGLYQVAAGRKGDVVLGQGDGYAVSSNIALGDLGTTVTETGRQVREGK